MAGVPMSGDDRFLRAAMSTMVVCAMVMSGLFMFTLVWLIITAPVVTLTILVAAVGLFAAAWKIVGEQ